MDRQAAAVHTEKSRQPLNGPCGAGLHTFQACMKAPLHLWAYTCSVTSMLMSRCANQPWPQAPFLGSHEAQEHLSLQPSHPEITSLPGHSACRMQGWPTVPGGDLELLNVFMRSGCHLKPPTGDNSQPRESCEHQPGPRAPPLNSHTALPWNCRPACQPLWPHYWKGTHRGGPCQRPHSARMFPQRTGRGTGKRNCN